MICRLAKVTGKVQGVYFRVSCQQKAIDLQLSGYAKNMPDGSVQVLMCGESNQIEQMIQWLHQGSEQSVVDNVNHHEVDWQSLNFFSIE